MWIMGGGEGSERVFTDCGEFQTSKIAIWGLYSSQLQEFYG